MLSDTTFEITLLTGTRERARRGYILAKILTLTAPAVLL